VQVSLKEFDNKILIDLRVWYQAPDGSLKPTAKGLTLMLDALPALTEALANAKHAAESFGLLLKGKRP
jgi:hypothetical protein